MRLKTMLAVVAGALGLCASAAVELPDGVSFEQEAKVVQPSEITEVKGATWAASDAENTTLEVKAYGSNPSYEYSKSDGNGRLEMFGDTQGSYLSVKTKIGNPVTRAQDVAMNGSGVYFDSLVKFTACDEEPTTEYSGAKLVVYVLEDEANAETNLIVKAGNGTYVIKEDVDVEAWHRLTIKSFKTIKASGSVPGFAIFLDGAAVSANEYTAPEGLSPTAKAFAVNKNLFVTLDEDSDDFETFKGVGFDGQGAIDDVAFSATAPVTAAEDPAFCTITIGKKVESFSVGGETYTGDAVVVATTDPMTVTAIVYKEGFFGPTSVDVAAGGTINLDTGAKDLVAKIGDANYESIEAALAAAQPNDEIVLQKDVAAEAAIAVNKAVTIDLNGKTVTGAAGANVFAIDAAVTFVDSGETGKVVAVQAGEEAEAVYAVALVEEPAGTPALTITGGTFTGAPENADFDLGFDVTPTITGGWFLNDPSTFLEGTDYEAAMDKTHDNYYKVTKVEKKGWAIYLAGAGTLEAPYEIADAGDLLDLATNLNKTADFATAGLYFKQTAEIDLTGITWEGIGTPKSAVAFAGTYDGDGQTIKNVTFAKSQYNGLFANVAGATIKNLTVTVAGFGGDDKSGENKWGAAAIVGFSNGVTIEGCTAKGATETTVFSGTHNIGGIGCRLEGEVLIKNCTNELALATTYSKCGGFCAIASSQNKLDDVWFNGNITFEGCVNKADITTDATQGKDGVAGIVGYIQCVGSNKVENAYEATSKTVNIKNCENLGTISGGCPAAFVGKVSSLGTQVLVGTISGNVYDANTVACGDSSALIDGLCYAQDGAYVANATALVKDATSVLTAKGLKPKFELQAENDYIAFDETLTTGNFDAITAAGELTIATNVTGKVTKFTAKAAQMDDPTVIDPKDIPENTKVSDIFKAVPADLANADASKFATWCQGKAKEGGASVGTAGADAKLDAFLLNCANDETAVEAAKEAFKIPEITVDADGTVTVKSPDGTYNGTVTIKGSATVDGKYELEADNAEAKFFKAILSL